MTWALASLTGCVESALNPGDSVSVTGSALEEDKSPLAAVELLLERSENSACLLTTGFGTVKTDSAGAYRHALTGAQTQNGEIARCFRLKLPRGDRGAEVGADFLVQITQVQVPALQRWRGSVAATQGAAGVELAFVDLSKSHGLSGLRYTALVRAGGGVLWERKDAVSPVVLSDFVLEDFAAASATLVTSSEQKGSGTTFTLRHETDSASLPQRQKVPASRGAGCSYSGAPASCPLTDGKLERVSLANDVTELTVSLTSPRTLKKVVLRGFGASVPATIVLEGSNGASWTKLADLSATEEFQEVDLLAGTPPIQTVRLRGTRTDGGTFALRTIAELSVFE